MGVIGTEKRRRAASPNGGERETPRGGPIGFNGPPAACGWLPVDGCLWTIACGPVPAGFASQGAAGFPTSFCSRRCRSRYECGRGGRAGRSRESGEAGLPVEPRPRADRLSDRSVPGSRPASSCESSSCESLPRTESSRKRCIFFLRAGVRPPPFFIREMGAADCGDFACPRSSRYCGLAPAASASS